MTFSWSNVKTFLTRILGFHSRELPTKYLGTQLALNPPRLANWHHTIEKIKNRLANWSFRTLNIAGRIVLLRSVLQAIPIYPLLATTVPKGACTKMVEIFKKLIRGGLQQQNKWALISWKGLTKSKEEGGLGLRDPYTLNKLMGGKLWWRWMKGGGDLFKIIWSQKYNMPTNTEDLLGLEEAPRGSTIWNLASQNRDIISKHAFWELRNGNSAKFWDEA